MQSKQLTSNIRNSNYDFELGVKGLSYEDLFNYEGLKKLNANFLNYFKTKDENLFNEFLEYQNGKELSDIEESELVIAASRFLSEYIGKLFGIEKELKELIEKTRLEDPIFRFKKEFVQRRVLKKYKSVDIKEFNVRNLTFQIERIKKLFFSHFDWKDEELSTAIFVNRFADLERAYKDKIETINEPKKIHPDEIKFAAELISELTKNENFKEYSNKKFNTEIDKYEFIKLILSLLERWVYWLFIDRVNNEKTKHWVSFKIPQNIDYFNLVDVERPNPNWNEVMIGNEKHYRRRDGFKLTDERFSKREVQSEVDYCVLCHKRDKDFCSKGYPAGKPEGKGEKDKSIRTNPLGIKLTGCPLEEKISEAHELKSEGLSFAALAVIMIDNPMVPGTGHRICNDCMKSCIYQKQEPVNIPQIETRILTDVLDLPYGFEIYHLLTRWNPLNRQSPIELPFNGRKVLVVGLGPAGYSLAHFLSNEGFGVVAIDGLKLEPMPEELIGDESTLPKPLKNFTDIYKELDERVLAGFGGVSEYGITVRWDKNFLSVIYLSLLRRSNIKMYGGIRFGGTITIDDAWNYGFDHIAIATGAGKPTIINIKNNISRGVRKASDFLMALQLTGAAKKSSMANLQVRLPAIVIGGGLTAIDTATELMAYYPAQVEKYLERYEKIVAEFGEEKFYSVLDEEEKQIAKTFLEHGKEIHQERKRAEDKNEKPNFIPLIRKWGGVKIAYRKGMVDSPAYRLNHEEIIKAFEEGIEFIEKLNPTEAVLDKHGSLVKVKFLKQSELNGKWCDSGEEIILYARSMFVAAGTSPNIVYEKEFPGSFELDKWKYFFQSFKLGNGSNNVSDLLKVKEGESGFFTSYYKDGKYISFYGDNHPEFAGNVVKAMASAKFGYKQISKLFKNDIENCERNYVKKKKDFRQLIKRLDDEIIAEIKEVIRLTPSITEIIVRAPMQAKKFQPGQFYRMQNYEVNSRLIEGTTLMMEGIALTGAWVDVEKGLLGMIALELGVSSKLLSTLKPGEKVIVMGPTGAPTHIPENENVMLIGGGLGNAVLFSIAKAMKEKNNKIIYFAGYKKPEDVYKMEEIEHSVDQVVWATDIEPAIKPRRKQDLNFVGNIVQAMTAYAKGQIDGKIMKLDKINRIIAIGSDRMMEAVKNARYSELSPYLNPNHIAIGSINSMMQCMMKEICAQCLQKHIDPKTGKETIVFSCFNQDQPLDFVDFTNLSERLKQNSVLEKQANLFFDYLIRKEPRNE